MSVRKKRAKITVDCLGRKSFLLGKEGEKKKGEIHNMASNIVAFYIGLRNLGKREKGKKRRSIVRSSRISQPPKRRATRHLILWKKRRMRNSDSMEERASRAERGRQLCPEENFPITQGEEKGEEKKRGPPQEMKLLRRVHQVWGRVYTSKGKERRGREEKPLPSLQRAGRVLAQQKGKYLKTRALYLRGKEKRLLALQIATSEIRIGTKSGCPR